MDDDNRNENVVSFRPRGGATPGLPPIPGAAPPAPGTAPPTPPAADAPDDDGAVAFPAPRRRRSAADSLAGLTPSLPPAPGPGATVALCSEGGDDEADGPGLGALGLAAALAVGLASLRGTATALQDWRQRRLEREAETAPLREARLKHQLAGEEAAARHGVAMQGINDKASQQRAKTAVPSSHDYGRKALGGGRGSLLAGGGGRGPGSGKGSGSGTGGTSRLGSTGTGSSPKPKTGASKGASGKTTLPSGNGKGAGASGKSGASGKGILSPSNGRSPGSKHSPALERVKGRNGRRASAQTARQERRGARQAAAIQERTQVRGEARQRKQAAKEARYAAKEARAEAKKKEKEATEADRTTLGEAAAKEARSRLKKRRKNLDPPVLTTVKPKKRGRKGKDGAKPDTSKVDLMKKPKPDPGSGATPKVDLTKKPKPDGGGTAPKVNLKKKPKGAKGSTGPGRRKARVKSKKSGGPGTGPSARRKARRKERTRRAGERAKAKATTAEDTTTGPGADWVFWEPPPRGERRSAYDSMRVTDPNKEEVWTVAPVFPVGYHAPAREPLTTGARGLPAGTGSTSTTITKEAPVGTPTSPAVATPMAAGMSAEHATEVTLDDVIDFLDEVVSEAFATHDECVLLAAKAKELMYALDELAVVLAQKHNIIGTFTSMAMQKLAESMELLARKTEEMQTESLNAAETCETAKTEMDDAYRPFTQAAADAGLRTPSARVHNEN